MAIRVDYTPMGSVGALAAQAGRAEASVKQAQIALQQQEMAQRVAMQQMSQAHEMNRMRFAAEIDQANQAAEFERQAQLVSMKKDASMQLELQDYIRKEQKFKAAINQIDEAEFINAETKEMMKTEAYARYAGADISVSKPSDKITPMESLNTYEQLKQKGYSNEEAAQGSGMKEPPLTKQQSIMKGLSDIVDMQFNNRDNNNRVIDKDWDKTLEARKENLFTELKYVELESKYAPYKNEEIVSLIAKTDSGKKKLMAYLNEQRKEKIPEDVIKKNLIETSAMAAVKKEKKKGRWIIPYFIERNK